MMLPIARRRFIASLRSPVILNAARGYAEHPQTDNTKVPANQPASNAAPVQNVSKTNELATSSMGAEDKAVQESVEAAEEMRTMQAPNRKDVWSRSQQPRSKAMTGPRFEQTIMADQVRLLLQLLWAYWRWAIANSSG